MQVTTRNERAAKIRTEAKNQGLNPNKWFNNVEIVASKRIGQETVHYVRNIYKYYTAYRLQLEAPWLNILDLWGRSGKFDITLPHTWADGSAKLDGQGRTRKVSGFNDPRLRLSMLLHGAPALSLEDFRNYDPDVIVGTSLEITAPLGKYQSDRLLNIGTNRWSFKPEVGVSKTLGPLTLELATGVRFYTDNDDFLDGRTLEVNPLYSVQAHLIYSITPGLWLGLNGLYYTGGRGTIDGRKGERLEDARIGLTLSLPINRYNSIKLYGSTDVYSMTGSTLDVLGVVWQFRWGAGL